MKKITLISIIALGCLCVCQLTAQTPSNPIMFVTQVPVTSDFDNIVATFGNHQSRIESVPRGGDLYIRYPDGTLKNVTAVAGFGSTTAFQGTDSIAVRDPHIHWSGTKAIFSMVVGATAQRYKRPVYYWQLYEVTGLGQNETPVITLVPNQPQDYNNVNPIYGTDDRIIFTTDRPITGERHLYPPLDEYEESPCVSGLWNLDPETGDLFLMEHSPSGSFDPIIDSYGRVIFTRWDHLQRDQQADGDVINGLSTGTFDYTDETDQAVAQFNVRQEIFPEPRGFRADLLAGTNLQGHEFNLFFPWMIEEDGTNMETLNHVGRHELHVFFSRSITDDSNVIDFTFTPGIRSNQNHLRNIFHMREDPTTPGLYYGTDAPEFQTHTSGQIITLTGQPDLNPEDMMVDYITHPDTRNVSFNPSANHSGLYRDPSPTTDGLIIAAHTAETEADDDVGTATSPMSKYDYRIKTLTQSGSHWVPGTSLTNGISKTINYWEPDFLITFSGDLWELQPVEIVSQTRPAPAVLEQIESQEKNPFNTEQVALDRFKRFLKANDLALIVMRNVTTRDDIDQQQPYNLKVSDEPTQTIGDSGAVYNVKYMQIFQADLLRGIGLFSATGTPEPGRRVLARHLHSDQGMNPTLANAPSGSVEIAPDGSVVAYVPSRRALSWQLTDAAGEPVVRERYWLSFQPGEIRTCTSCHGLNKQDQAGGTTPANIPDALKSILQTWKSDVDINAHITNFVMGMNNDYSFDVVGEANETFLLQRSSNLDDWADVGSYQIPATPPHSIAIQESFATNERYYYRLQRTVN